MLNREALLPLDVMIENSDSLPYSCPVEYAEWIKQAITEAHSLAREHLQTSAKRQKKYYDKNSATAGFKTGVWVWHYYPPKAKQKLGRPWRGPYLIVGKP